MISFDVVQRILSMQPICEPKFVLEKSDSVIRHILPVSPPTNKSSYTATDVIPNQKRKLSNSNTNDRLSLVINGDTKLSLRVRKAIA